MNKSANRINNKLNFANTMELVGLMKEKQMKKNQKITWKNAYFYKDIHKGNQTIRIRAPNQCKIITKRMKKFLMSNKIKKKSKKI